MTLSAVFELMDSGHKGSLIKIWHKHLAVKGPFPKAHFTWMILLDPRNKGPTANRATGMADFGKFIQTGHTDRKPGPFRTRPIFFQEVPTDRAQGRINEVEELPKNGHR
jgi:hypothetical protein